MDYLRACILILISLGTDREKFIDLIDMSLISPSSEDSLTTTLSSREDLILSWLEELKFWCGFLFVRHTRR